MQEILHTKVWALESGFFNTMQPLVLKRLANGGNLDALVQPNEKRVLAAGLEWDDASGLIVSKTEQGAVAIIEISGTMTKKGGACSYGTKQMGSMIARANKADHIKAIVLDMDTPGGAVDGQTEFAEIIKASAKPIVTYTDGLLCSAGYWTASATSWIVANKHNYNTIGSIGTLCMLMDQSEWLKKEGLKVEIIRAEQSVDKALLNAVEPASDEIKAELKAELTAITDDFIAAVNAGRGERLQAGEENVFTGKTYGLAEALSMGLVDQAGSLQDAISKALELANDTTSKKSDMKLSNLFGSKKADVSAPVVAETADAQSGLAETVEAAVAEVISADGTVAGTATEETPEAAAEVEAAADPVAAIQAQLAEAVEARAAAEAQVAQLQKTVATQAATIKRLELAGDSASVVAKDGDTAAGATVTVSDPQAAKLAAMAKARNK